MVQPSAALLALAFAFLCAAPASGEAPSVEPAPAAAIAVAPALPTAGVLETAAPTDETGCLIRSAPVSAPPPLDLRRPRLVAAATPETPHPAAGGADAEAASPLPDLHLVRLTKDRGS